MRAILTLLTMHTLLALVAGCGGASVGGTRDEAFAYAVEASVEEDWGDAVAGALSYLSRSTEDDERYDRAQMIVATGLERLDLRYGAALYFADVAQARRDVALTDEAISGLERLVTSGPVDEDLILRAFVSSADLSGLRPALADFVHYHRGLDSVRRGETVWASESFDAISDESHYWARAEMARVALALDEGELDDARARLSALLDDEVREAPLPEDVRIEARIALARIALDQERYLSAIASYQELQDLAPRRPSLLLEMAWAHYYRGNYRRSLGLLLALDAPVYGGLIAPERYLLEAYNLRRLCQLEAARVAARRLHDRHHEALDDLRSGTPPVDSESLRAAALQRPMVLRRTRLTRATRAESEIANDLADRAGDDGQPLRVIYEWANARLQRRLDNAVDEEVRLLAQELIGASDGVRLILHELSVQLLRGRARPAGPPPRDRVGSIPDGEVGYAFDGEFWTDEIDDLEVVIEDRCLE